METVQKISENMVQPIFYFMFNKYMLMYVVVNVFTFLIVKHWGIRDQIRGKNSKQVEEKYKAFWRGDLDNLHVGWCLPFYCLFWPRFFLMLATVALAGTASEMLVNEDTTERTAEASKTTEKGQRSVKLSVVKRLIQNACFHCFYTGGYTRYTTEQVEVDFSEYLGEKDKDWKVEWSGASTLISNHISWFDVAFAIFYYFPVLTSRETIRSTPFIGSVFRAMNAIFIARAGKDAAESKKIAAKAITDH